jgi:hypothetical protein
MMVPGRRARALAAAWCSPKTIERLIDPVVSDLQIEYEAALSRGQRFRSLWIWITGHVAIGKVLALHSSARGIEMIAGMSIEERRDVVRTAVWVIATILVVATLLAAPPLRAELARNREDRLILVLLLMPQALPIAIPVGLVVGILQALRHGAPTRVSRALILAIAIVLSIGSFAFMGWVIPETNQTYRETIFRRLTANGAVDGGVSTLSRGPSELSLGQLRRAAAEQSREGALQPDIRRRSTPNLAFVYYMRWAVSFAPVVLALFAVVAATRLTRSRALRWLIAFGTVGGYWAIYFVADPGFDRDRAWPILMAWAPNLALLAVTAAIARLARPRMPSAAA